MPLRGSILDQAFADIGFASYKFDLEPDEIGDAYLRLDRMMAQLPWSRLTYVAGGDNPNSSDEIGTPAWADEAIIANLAIRLAPTYGKSPLGEINRQGRAGRDMVQARTATIPYDRRSPVPVIGAGDWRRRLDIDTLG